MSIIYVVMKYKICYFSVQIPQLKNARSIHCFYNYEILINYYITFV